MEGDNGATKTTTTITIAIIVIIIMSFIIDYFLLVPCLLLTRVVVLVGLHVVHLAWVMFFFSPGSCLLLACISTLHSAPHHHHHIASITSHHITLHHIHVTAQLFDSSDFSRQAHRPHCLGAGA